MSLQQPRASDLLRDTFGATVVHLVRGGRTLVEPPDWIRWPTVRLSEMGPAPTPPCDLVRPSGRRCA